MLVGAKVCDLTEYLLWYVCGNFDVSPKAEEGPIQGVTSKVFVGPGNVHCKEVGGGSNAAQLCNKICY